MYIVIVPEEKPKLQRLMKLAATPPQLVLPTKIGLQQKTAIRTHLDTVRRDDDNPPPDNKNPLTHHPTALARDKKKYPKVSTPTRLTDKYQTPHLQSPDNHQGTSYVTLQILEKPQDTPENQTSCTLQVRRLDIQDSYNHTLYLQSPADPQDYSDLQEYPIYQAPHQYYLRSSYTPSRRKPGFFSAHPIINLIAPGSIQTSYLQSHSLICIENNLYIVGIGPTLQKMYIYIYQSYRSDFMYMYSQVSEYTI